MFKYCLLKAIVLRNLSKNQQGNSWTKCKSQHQNHSHRLVNLELGLDEEEIANVGNVQRQLVEIILIGELVVCVGK